MTTEGPTLHRRRGISFREKPVPREERPRQPIDNASGPPMTPATRRSNVQHLVVWPREASREASCSETRKRQQTDDSVSDSCPPRPK